MSYTLNDNPIGNYGYCPGTTKAGKPCKRRGYIVFDSVGFWCPAHGKTTGPNRGPNPEQLAIIEDRAEDDR